MIQLFFTINPPDLVHKYSWSSVPSMKWRRLSVENREHDQHLQMLLTEVIIFYVSLNRMQSQEYVSSSENQDIQSNL